MLGFDVQSEDEKVQLAKKIASDPEFTAVLDKFQNAALRKLQMENLQTGIDNEKKEVATRDEISKFMTQGVLEFENHEKCRLPTSPTSERFLLPPAQRTRPRDAQTGT